MRRIYDRCVVCGVSGNYFCDEHMSAFAKSPEGARLMALSPVGDMIHALSPPQLTARMDFVRRVQAETLNGAKT